MAMEPCARCGVVDPHLMFGLMSRWFALPAGLTVEGGYFYLCPRCFDSTIAPDLDEILDRLREHHPAPGATLPAEATPSSPTEDHPAAGSAPSSAAPPPPPTEFPPPSAEPARPPETSPPRQDAP